MYSNGGESETLFSLVLTIMTQIKSLGWSFALFGDADAESSKEKQDVGIYKGERQKKVLHGYDQSHGAHLKQL